MFGSCICVDPDEVCELVRQSTPVARKEHRCIECRCSIKPGQPYEKDVTVFYGEMETHRTCLPCRNVRASLFRCGWYYGRVWEDVHESICGEDDDGNKECVCP